MSENEKVLRNYINGKWVVPHSKDTLDVLNPANNRVLAKVPLSDTQDTHDAVEAAGAAFEEWRVTPIPKRIEYLSRLFSLMNTDEFIDKLAHLITTEHGKVLSDAAGEIGRALENLRQSLNIDFLSGRKLSNIASGNIEEESILEPNGVHFGIMPFNFPVMIPFWYFAYALASGNTYIVKPSPQTPMCMTRIFELIDEAGFPPGVINLLHGDREVSDALLEHPGTAGVEFVGSTVVARQIYQRAVLNGKRAICQGGAKNLVAVTEDVDRDKVIPHIIDSVFGNSGQRCLAGSNVVLVGTTRFYKEMTDRLVEAARQLKVGDGTREGVDMGPVISQEAKERIFSYIQQGVPEGARFMLDGRNVEFDGDPNGYWVGPTIFADVRPDMTIACDEIFGPVMTIMHVQSLDEAIVLANNSPYGNAAMLFTESGKAASLFKYEVRAGNIGINIGLPAPIPPFPFGGMKDSFFGELHGQGMEDMRKHFTQEKVVIVRWL